MNIGIKKRKKIRPVIHLVVRELRPAKVKKPVPAKEINDLFWFRDESYCLVKDRRFHNWAFEQDGNTVFGY